MGCLGGQAPSTAPFMYNVDLSMYNVEYNFFFYGVYYTDPS